MKNRYRGRRDNQMVKARMDHCATVNAMRVSYAANYAASPPIVVNNDTLAASFESLAEAVREQSQMLGAIMSTLVANRKPRPRPALVVRHSDGTESTIREQTEADDLRL